MLPAIRDLSQTSIAPKHLTASVVVAIAGFTSRQFISPLWKKRSVKRNDGRTETVRDYGLSLRPCRLGSCQKQPFFVETGNAGGRPRVRKSNVNSYQFHRIRVSP